VEVKGSQNQLDYVTYREIMGDLLQPISSEGLDFDTLKRLYESKVVYLENLRIKCFKEINSGRGSHFTSEDHTLIIKASAEANKQLRQIVLLAITDNLAKRQVS
jgi:hypothetical protein